MLLSIVNTLILSKNATAASTLWRHLIEQNWVVCRYAMSPTIQASFAIRLGSVSIGRSRNIRAFIHGPVLPGWRPNSAAASLKTAAIAEQTVVLQPGKYAMSYSYRTTDILSTSGIRWQIVDAKSEAVLEESPYLSSDALSVFRIRLLRSRGTPPVQVRLDYRRALGTPRISGMLDVSSTRIQAIP